jgi:betaine-aldehyde dehydrogenase
MVDQIRFFAGAARVLEGRAAGEYMPAHLVDPARADRRRRAGHPVELPDDDGGLEDRARRSPRATPSSSSRATPPRDHPAAGRDGREFLPAGTFNVITGDRDTGRMVVEHRTPTWSRSPARCAPAPRSRPARRRGPQARPPRARRQGPGRRLRRRRHRGGRRGHRRRRLLQRRPGLHRRHPGARRPRHPRRLRRGARRVRRNSPPVGLPDDEDALFGPVNNPASWRTSPGFIDRSRPRDGLAGGNRRHRPRRRLLPRADRALRAAPGRRGDPERDLRPGHHGAAFTDEARRSAGPTASTTAWRPRCGPRTSAGRCG